MDKLFSPQIKSAPVYLKINSILIDTSFCDGIHEFGNVLNEQLIIRPVDFDDLK
jgi:hypothetical protein